MTEVLMRNVHLIILILLICMVPLYLFAACGPGKAEDWDDDDDSESGETESDDDYWDYDDDSASGDDDESDDDSTADDDDTSTDDDDDSSWDVAVLDDGITGQSLINLLATADISGYIWGLETEYDGSDLNARVAILIDGGAAVWGVDMPEAGQQGLLDFVSAGGGLMITEWVLRDHQVHGQYDLLSTIFPVDLNGDGWGTKIENYTVAMPSHPIAFDLPSEFSVSPISFSPLAAIRGDVVITGDHSGDAIVADATNVGRVVYCAFAGASDGLSGALDIWTDPMSALAINIVSWLSE